jgi:hypothetical protein
MPTKASLSRRLMRSTLAIKMHNSFQIRQVSIEIRIHSWLSLVTLSVQQITVLFESDHYECFMPFAHATGDCTYARKV